PVRPRTSSGTWASPAPVSATWAAASFASFTSGAPGSRVRSLAEVAVSQGVVGRLAARQRALDGLVGAAGVLQRVDHLGGGEPAPGQRAGVELLLPRDGPAIRVDGVDGGGEEPGAPLDDAIGQAHGAGEADRPGREIALAEGVAAHVVELHLQVLK